MNIRSKMSQGFEEGEGGEGIGGINMYTYTVMTKYSFVLTMPKRGVINIARE